MVDVTRDHIEKAVGTARWAALTALDAVSADLHNFDRRLVREPRLLVPVDVQALVVQAGVNDAEPMVRLPFRDTEGGPAPDVHDPGTPRPAGVHLLWTVPAALGHGSVVDDPAAPGDATRRRLDLPALPDRWVVLRLVVPAGGRTPLVTGWVIDAAAATVTPLADYPTVMTRTQSVGTAVAPEQLTMHVGGQGWAQAYDGAQGRLALHDPVTDLDGVELEGDAISYVVAGWWTRSGDDPLDGVGSDIGYRARLDALGWNDPDHPSPERDRRSDAAARHKVSELFGLPVVSRHTQDASLRAGKAVSRSFTPGYVAAAGSYLYPAVSGFATEAIAAALLPPAPARTTLLHGRIHGVPLRRGPQPDNRPDGAALRAALGASTTDVAASMAVAGSALGTPDEVARRAAERLLAAFSAGLMVQLQQTDTWADIDAFEHTRAFGTLPGGTDGVDRFVGKPAAGSDPGSGFRPGVKVGPKLPVDQITVESKVLWSAKQRPAYRTVDSLKYAAGASTVRSTAM
ncbi:MAG TPA: hypothetical protein VEZ46_01625, partial [Mycobacteriales bacterium]|nr:hypothetical protein [Mycobacteriales bacterium]